MKTLRVSVSSERITRQVAMHFADAEEMHAYLNTIYQQSPALPELANDCDRCRHFEMFPATVLFWDVMSLWKVLGDLRRGTWRRDEWVTCRRTDEQARQLWHALEALINLNGTPEGPGILASLTWLLPKKANPRSVLHDIRWFLDHGGAEELRQSIASYFAENGTD